MVNISYYLDLRKVVLLLRMYENPSGNVFEPIVIFFGLINSLAILQAMMNDLLRDMIETKN